MNTTNLKLVLCQVLKSCQIHFKVIINPGKRISLYIMFLIKKIYNDLYDVIWLSDVFLYFLNM